MSLREGRNAAPLPVLPFRPSKRARRLAIDAALWLLATPIAAVLFRPELPADRSLGGLAHLALVLVALKLGSSLHHRLPRRSWRKVSLRDVVVLTRVLATAALLAGLIALTPGPWLDAPLGLVVLDALVAFVLMLGVRALSRLLHERALERGTIRPARSMRRVLIVGAGEAGTLVAREMQRHPEMGLRPVGFVDDDPGMAGGRVAGTPVLGRTEELSEVVRRHAIDEVFVAIPSADAAVIRDLKRALELEPSVRYRVVPGVYELLGGRVRLERIREVDIADLLGRPPVELDVRSILGYLEGQTVMVTGAGGSIGSELVRQICAFRPRALVLFGHGENSIFRLERELDRAWPGLPYHSVIGAVQNGARLEAVFRQVRPDVVVHAAAHKHVPLMELNPEEAVFNNVIGSRNLLEMALEYRVSHFVNISTDKAVNPTSVMGASKRMVECLVQEASLRARDDQVFVSVRFGNVLGSRGSVIPVFRDQIRAGGPLTVTHPDMVRYFMTIPEAAQLVLQASAQGRNGEIYILNMGEPVRILDLARDMIRLSGLEPDVDIAIEFTGVRPGEKLFEELTTGQESVRTTAHDKIFVARPVDVDDAVLAEQVARLTEAALHSDGAAIRAALNEFIPGCALEGTQPGPRSGPTARGATPGAGVNARP